jgi:hypothetical protein
MASSYSALNCSSWVCNSDWEEQIAAIAADVEEPDAVDLDVVLEV